MKVMTQLDGCMCMPVVICGGGWAEDGGELMRILFEVETQVGERLVHACRFHECTSSCIPMAVVDYLSTDSRHEGCILVVL